jgi:hypothetical protein
MGWIFGSSDPDDARATNAKVKAGSGVLMFSTTGTNWPHGVEKKVTS